MYKYEGSLESGYAVRRDEFTVFSQDDEREWENEREEEKEREREGVSDYVTDSSVTETPISAIRLTEIILVWVNHKSPWCLNAGEKGKRVGNTLRCQQSGLTDWNLTSVPVRHTPSYLRHRRYVFIVCLSVWLAVCLSVSKIMQKLTWQILKLGGGVEHWPRKNPFNFVCAYWP